MTRNLITTILIALAITCKAETVTINDSKPQPQQWEGWGVSLCWWANMCGRHSEEQLDSLINWLTSPDELNYNIFRYNIGGGDDPQWRNCKPHHMGRGKGLRAEMEGFLDGPQSDYNWQRDEGQRRVTRMINSRRKDAIFEAFSNSAPWWMTKSGCVAGHKSAVEDNLREDCYGLFAKYLIDVCLYLQQNDGITFRTLEPFNEGLTDYWYQSGSQEGCHFSSEAQVRLLKVLHPMMQQRGLRAVIAASDETSVRRSTDNFLYYKKEDALKYVGQWNTHTYSGNNEERARLHQLAAESGIRLWQSETGDGGRGLHGNLRMAQRLIDDIRHLKPSAWLDWQYVEENHDQWSLVMCDSTWGKFRRHKNYYVRMHFSRFIPAGYRWLETGGDNALAAISPDGQRMTVVAVNTTREPMTVALNAASGTKWRIKETYRTSRTEDCAAVATATAQGNAADGNTLLSQTLPPLSIMTFVFER